MKTVNINKIIIGAKAMLPCPVRRKLGEVHCKSIKFFDRHFPELYRYTGRAVKLKKDIAFPPSCKGNKKIKLGPIAYLIAYGGDLSVERMVEGAKRGISPFFKNGEPYLWWMADQRCVLFLDSIHIERPIKSMLKKNMYTMTADKAFLDVVYGCRDSHDCYVWLNDDRIKSLQDLHEAGYTHSIELWQEDQLVGGLFGFHMGEYFHIESKFGTVNNGSKYTFIAFCLRMQELGFKFCDCGHWPTDHLERLGASVIEGDEYMMLLNDALLQESPICHWENLFCDCNVQETAKSYLESKTK